MVVPLRGREREAVHQERRCSEWTTRPRHPVHPTPYHSARRLALFTRHCAASSLCNRDAATHRLIVNCCSGISRANGDRLDSVTSAVLAYTTRDSLGQQRQSCALASTSDRTSDRGMPPEAICLQQ
jgi:hypothetical protein